MKLAIQLLFLLITIGLLAGCNEVNSSESSSSTDSQSETEDTQTSDNSEDSNPKSLVIGTPIDIKGWDEFISESSPPAEVLVEFDEETMKTTITLLSGEGSLIKYE